MNPLAKIKKFEYNKQRGEGMMIDLIEIKHELEKMAKRLAEIRGSL
jgi:hypothetical protein